MKKYLLPHVLIISFVFLLAPTVHVASYAGDIKRYREAVRKNPDDAAAYFALGVVYVAIKDRDSALEQYKILKNLDSKLANELFNLIYK